MITSKMKKQFSQNKKELNKLAEKGRQPSDGFINLERWKKTIENDIDELMQRIVDSISKIKPFPVRGVDDPKSGIPSEAIIDQLMGEVYRYRKFNEDWEFIAKHISTLI